MTDEEKGALALRLFAFVFVAFIMGMIMNAVGHDGFWGFLIKAFLIFCLEVYMLGLGISPAKKGGGN